MRRLPSPCGPASVPYRLVLKQLVYAAITKRAAKQDPARYTGMRPPRAGMAELADAKVSKTFERKLVRVRPPPPAPNKIRHLFTTWNVFVDDHGAKLCQFCANAIPGTG